MVSNYRKHDPEFRKRVVLEYLNGESTMAQICNKYQISSGLLSYWKKRFEKGVLESDPKNDAAKEKKIAELERMIGRLTMENALLKKTMELSQQRLQSRERLYPKTVVENGQSESCVK